ncbi:MAG: DNA repair protein RecO [Pseudomonadota bacterium]
MEWRDRGLLLSTRRFGESAAIIEVLTLAHGRHAGLVRGGASSRMAPVLQPGAELDLAWRARLDDHLGVYRVEPVRSRAALLMADRRRLACFNAMVSLVLACMPEREPQGELYLATSALADRLASAEDWETAYALWENALLTILGFGLDLTACAATGDTEDLIWVSPKSGRAVSRQGGIGWEHRLLPLPQLLGGSDPRPDEAGDALRLTGHFLTHWVLPAIELDALPEARQRLERVLART